MYLVLIDKYSLNKLTKQEFRVNFGSSWKKCSATGRMVFKLLRNLVRNHVNLIGIRKKVNRQLTETYRKAWIHTDGLTKVTNNKS